MAGILRGDVFWADLNPVMGQEQAGKSPVLVISQDVFNERSGAVIALAITSQAPRAGFPLTCGIDEKSLPKQSWVKISQVRTLSVLRLDSRITRLSPELVNHVVDGLNEIFGA